MFRFLRNVLVCAAVVVYIGTGSAEAQRWTPVYNDGCDGEGHRVLVGEITTRATLGDGCDLVAGYVAPDQRYAGEWVWGYSPTAGAVTHASADDATYFRPHICDVVPRFPFAPTDRWKTRVVQPQEFLYNLYGSDYPAYIAASCRLRERDTAYAQIGLDRALVPGSKLAEPPADLVDVYNEGVLGRERVTLDVPNGRLTMVFPGDSLGRFAEIFDVSLADLQAANRMSDPNALLVGQLLLVPDTEQGRPPGGSSSATEMRQRLQYLCRVPVLRILAPIARLCDAMS